MKLIILLLLLGIAQAKVLRTPEEWRQALPRQARVKTSLSMKGYQPGDLLIVKPAHFDQIKAGDRVFCWPSNQPIPYFHVAIRWIGPNPLHKKWITRGDNNPREDSEPITEDTYIGEWGRKS